MNEFIVMLITVGLMFGILFGCGLSVIFWVYTYQQDDSVSENELDNYDFDINGEDERFIA